MRDESQAWIVIQKIQSDRNDLLLAQPKGRFTELITHTHRLYFFQ
jgi:hypothetical protein